VTRRTIVAVCSIVVFMLASATGAQAARVVHRDGNDTAGALDLEFIGGVKNRAHGKLVVGVRTYAGWDKRLLSQDGANRIVFYFNINRDSGAEYRGEVSFAGGALVLQLFGRNAPTRLLQVDRVDRSTIRVTIPRRWPANPKGDVRIAAKSRLTGSGTCSNTCEDRAPDRGWLLVEAG
jgi:hypothetical protein